MALLVPPLERVDEKKLRGDLKSVQEVPRQGLEKVKPSWATKPHKLESVQYGKSQTHMKPSHCENARAGTARLPRRLEGKFLSNLSSRFERKPFSVCRSPFHHGERSRHTECPSRSSPLLFWRSWSRQLRGKAANPSTAFLRCHSVSARSLSPRLCIGEGHSVLEVIFHGFFKE
jgi:hypothetical protein